MTSLVGLIRIISQERVRVIETPPSRWERVARPSSYTRRTCRVQSGHGGSNSDSQVGSLVPNHSAIPANVRVARAGYGNRIRSSVIPRRRSTLELNQRIERLSHADVDRSVDPRGIAPRDACLQGTTLTFQTSPYWQQWRQRGSNPRCETASLASSQLDDVPSNSLTKLSD
jgi:hypothetical protein